MRLHGNKRQKLKQQQQQQCSNTTEQNNENEVDAAINQQQRGNKTGQQREEQQQVEQTRKETVYASATKLKEATFIKRRYTAHPTTFQVATTQSRNHTRSTAAPPHSAPLLLYTVPRLLILFVLCCAMPPQAHADWLMDCGDCLCKWQSGKKTADCKNLTLSAVPENLSNEVQVLDLSFNRVAILEQNAFLNADLHNLHKLFMRNASLQQIDPRTFTQLEILIEVDLSNNLLRNLQANVFARLVKVRAIVLNGNLLETLSDGVFQNLKYLHKVELKHNRLMRIGQQAFGNVPLLSQIYLDGNRLSFLRKESFESLKRLTALSLDSNPWNCTCELQIFRDFVLKRNLYTPPTACYYPVHLRGMLWVEDQPEAFACKPRIIFPARGASVSTSKENVTLVCRVHASPNTHITWDYNRQQYRSSTSNIGGGINAVTTNSGGGCCANGQAQRLHIELLRDEQTKEKEFGRDVFISRLTIVAAEKSDEGTYTCTAENAGGKDSVQISLLVQRPGSRELLLQGNLVVVVSLMALGLLGVSVFLALVTCCIYKRFKAMSPTSHRHHHHHLDGADQLTPGMDGQHTTTTTVTGGTDVVLGMDDTVGSYKHHLQKKNANGDVVEGKGSGGGGGVGVGSGKYTEVIKHGVTVMDNGGMLSGIGSRGGGIDGTAAHRSGPHADKMYLERSNDDTLHIKYPHGPSAADINRLLNATTTTTLDMTLGGKGGALTGIGGGGKWRTEVQITEGQLGGVGGRAGEYQPDLLPAYSTHKSVNNSCSNSNINGHANSAVGNQQGQLYSPIKPTRTINLHDDQQMSQQQQQQTTHQQQQPIVAKSKYNINAQEYLQSRYGTASKPHEKTLRRGDVIAVATTSIALTTTGSLPTTTVSVSSGAVPQSESGFSTLQRHSKSVALPPRTPTDTHAVTVAASTSSNSYGYEYRQPPPPPYNSAHRTASGLQLLQRRTSINNEANNSEQTGATKDLGYRETISGSNYGGAGVGDGARQTIVTASSSLQFLTTTGYGGNAAPQRQLL
ncbi:uncharacterized protein LOC105215508 [Zeugodacus cucurbitae]|uniref:uncharacterized protein LOC105215508 n=1 Tax=Zeugodacus cucurbitae TaxID=28588 RepID=UPI0023D8F72D|nr:uncharacterized protein LOC105215508 [Zeugodacus cucurbitae]XP_054088116.1 uncharacterized protein LOC105215508 [Zeugodacus cucurbitae]XP_054088117.1 uncharacterized protein LOC105215508 [Zeugodacus cucurbitae]XP_054088119.1 uncharacterized protein LOC105215508 [Zeugodacus cucurbitae]XP_054088120.1 uncharacterized protein LOC105215508 [Zeugodacus cucurbitae]